MYSREHRRTLRKDCGSCGWVLIIYYLIMNVLVESAAVSAAYCEMIRSNHFSEEFLSESYFQNAWGYHAAIWIGLFLLICWKGTSFWKQEIWEKSRKMTAADFIRIVAVFIAVQTFASLFAGLLDSFFRLFRFDIMQAYEELGIDQPDNFSMAVYSGLLAPFSEEILFRGVVLRKLKAYGKRFAIICSAFLFGVFHGNLVQAPYAFFLGLVFGYVAMEYSVFWSIVLHALNNLVIVDWMGRLMRVLPEWIFLILDGGIFWGFTIAGIVILIKNRYSICHYRTENTVEKELVFLFFTNPGIISCIIVFGINMVLMIG